MKPRRVKHSGKKTQFLTWIFKGIMFLFCFFVFLPVHVRDSFASVALSLPLQYLSLELPPR